LWDNERSVGCGRKEDSVERRKRQGKRGKGDEEKKRQTEDDHGFESEAAPACPEEVCEELVRDEAREESLGSAPDTSKFLVVEQFRHEGHEDARHPAN
jgi:hypothetical protein